MIKKFFMKNSVNNEIKLSSDAINSIVEISVSEVEGAFLSKSFSTKIFKGSPIQSTVNLNSIDITIPIVIEYGLVIPTISNEIQRLVKENVEIMTSLEVLSVNIIVEGIIQKNK